MGSKARYGLVVYNDDAFSFEDIKELLQLSMGYDPIRALQCAVIIHNAGYYNVKSFKSIDQAEAVYEFLVKNGVSVELVELGKKS